MDMKGAKYSLWLMSSEHVYSRLLDLILELGKDFGWSLFDPHVTLIVGLSGPEEEVLCKTLRLVKLLRSFTVELESVDYLDEFSRCLFTRVKQTQDMISAHSRAQEVFGRSRDVLWARHLSLLYGDFPSTTKDKIMYRRED